MTHPRTIGLPHLLLTAALLLTFGSGAHAATPSDIPHPDDPAKELEHEAILALRPRERRHQHGDPERQLVRPFDWASGQVPQAGTWSTSPPATR